MNEASDMILGVRINFHDQDKSIFYSACLVPLAREAQGRAGIRAAWIQSHWLFGPHAMLYLHGAAQPVQVLATELSRRIEDYLADHPSTVVIKPEEHEEASRQLGRLELVEPPYLPLRADNTVELVHGHCGDTFLRSSEAVQIKGQLIGQGLERIVDANGAVIGGTPALEDAFRGMAAIACSYPKWGLISGYQAFLSHWKEYFFWADTDGRLSGPLQESYAAQRAQLVAVVESARSAAAGNPTADRSVQGWGQWASKSLPIAMELAKTGDILPYPHPSRVEKAAKFSKETEIQWSGSDDRNYSDFHQAFRKLDFTKLGNGTDFAAYRFIINNFFELLPLMGITPMQRYSLAFMFTQAAQEVVGETWDVTIDRSLRRQLQRTPDLRPTLPWVGENA